MRRYAVLLSALAALMFVWTGSALAQTTTDESPPPGCNGTIFLSSSAGDTPGTEPKFTRGDTIYVNGTGFDPNQQFTGWTVEDVNDHVIVIDNSSSGWAADASGNFSFSFSSSGLTDDHEYKVTVYYTKAVGSEECQKSKNFFLTSEEGGGAGGNPPPPPPPPSGGGAGAGGGGGSLGEEAGSAGAGALPFTGVPFAILGIAGLTLLLGGLALMRSGRTE